MINVSRVIHSPNFAQTFQVKRITGTWENGRFTTTEKTILMSGTVLPLNTKEMNQLPEGDRIHGGIKIHTTEPLYVTRLKQSTQTDGALADEVLWDKERWKILQTQNYSQYGYYSAIATRILGA